MLATRRRRPPDTAVATRLKTSVVVLPGTAWAHWTAPIAPTAALTARAAPARLRLASAVRLRRRHAAATAISAAGSATPKAPRETYSFHVK